MTNLRHKLPRSSSLKRKLLIDNLFSQGRSIMSFPVRLVYLPISYPEDSPFLAGFSVPKKKFKKATDRNRIKRLMREAFRLQQHQLNLPEKTVMMWIYTGKNMPDYDTIYQKVSEIIHEFNKQNNQQSGQTEN